MRRLSDRVAAHPDDRDVWLEPHLIDPTLPRPPAPRCRKPRGQPPNPERPTLPAKPPRRTDPPAPDKARKRFPVHAEDHAVRLHMQAELEAFHEAYIAASAAFRDGDIAADFPAYCIKPTQPWPSAVALGRSSASDASPAPANAAATNAGSSSAFVERVSTCGPATAGLT